MSLSPLSNEARSGSNAKRRVELLRPHLAREFAAHGQVRVAQVRLHHGQRLCKTVRPAAETAFGVRIDEALGGAVPEGDEAPVSHTVHATEGAPHPSQLPDRRAAALLVPARGVAPAHEDPGARAARRGPRPRLHPRRQRLQRRPRRLQPALGRPPPTRRRARARQRRRPRRRALGRPLRRPAREPLRRPRLQRELDQRQRGRRRPAKPRRHPLPRRDGDDRPRRAHAGDLHRARPPRRDDPRRLVPDGGARRPRPRRRDGARRTRLRPHAGPRHEHGRRHRRRPPPASR